MSAASPIAAVAEVRGGSRVRVFVHASDGSVLPQHQYAQSDLCRRLTRTEVDTLQRVGEVRVGAVIIEAEPPDAEYVRRELRRTTRSVYRQMRRTGWWYRGLEDSERRGELQYGLPCEWDVNCGWCGTWAELARVRVGGEVVWLTDDDGDPYHAVLRRRGRYYDSQHLDGVEAVGDLDIVRGVSREEFIAKSPGSAPSKRTWARRGVVGAA